MVTALSVGTEAQFTSISKQINSNIFNRHLVALINAFFSFKKIKNVCKNLLYCIGLFLNSFENILDFQTLMHYDCLLVLKFRVVLERICVLVEKY